MAISVTSWIDPPATAMTRSTASSEHLGLGAVHRGVEQAKVTNSQPLSGWVLTVRSARAPL